MKLKLKLFSAHIEEMGLEFVINQLNLTTKWPVLQKDNWNKSLWETTEFYRYIVDYFIDTDLKNTSRRALYVRTLSVIDGYFRQHSITT